MRWRRNGSGSPIDGVAHAHSFVLDNNGKNSAKVHATRQDISIASGVSGFTFMKSTESGWDRFVQDQYTTLPDTRDRMCATSMDATWRWQSAPANFPAANAKIVETMLKVFATTYSESVQDSLYRMGIRGAGGGAGIDRHHAWPARTSTIC